MNFQVVLILAKLSTRYRWKLPLHTSRYLKLMHQAFDKCLSSHLEKYSFVKWPGRPCLHSGFLRLLWVPISMWWYSPQNMAICPLSASTSLLHCEMPGHEHGDPYILTCRLKAVWTVNSGSLVIPTMVQGRRLQVGMSLRPHASPNCSQPKMSTGGH